METNCTFGESNVYRLIISGSMYLAWVWVVARVSVPESLSKNSFLEILSSERFPESLLLILEVYFHFCKP